MIRYLIDTDISSYFLKKRHPSLDRRMRAALMANAVGISAEPPPIDPVREPQPAKDRA
ncbi:hypothetical protein ThimaDRAFT_3528 [Thiocapsa marina 5811]|uniref:Uncharacterized protein n=1 Tax=Thiocapsa marina 5811 TaxID=768671 RepID=F9UF25_9GAMM|nr:hypothetical protein ThimaDRAFT_3528 [Thiocapsa marina 5811]